MKLNFFKTSAALVMLFLFSCTKEGETGPAGKDGNANVVTRSFSVTTSGWQASGTAGMGELYCTLVDSNVTQGILDSGSVQVFQQLGYAELLPITSVGTAPWGNYLTITTAQISLNKVSIHRYRSDDSLPHIPAYTTTYKVVVTGGHH